MNDQVHIVKYYELTDCAMESLFNKFKENPKLILTESDLKCWLFMELQVVLNDQDLPFSVHTEVTHYLRNPQIERKLFMRDLTILNDKNLNLNEEIWNKNNNQEHTLSKGFQHIGPALHFELKLVRNGKSIGETPTIDPSDICNLNKVDGTKRAYCIVWGSKSDNVSVGQLKESLNAVIDNLTNIKLVEDNRLSIYLFDKDNFEKVELTIESISGKVKMV
ncbi:hypothetical protein IF125_12900 [Empedobacter stercoris]|uniref:hypothetical protein n=1 Tax=Empedobacter stercoris TaxID=1628248 RepID=UPI001CE100CE|nr:hypothetical protein [Empedobacter stercoris]MCA4783141.1 hypothetical protein [Empedobacter stercoris]